MLEEVSDDAIFPVNVNEQIVREARYVIALSYLNQHHAVRKRGQNGASVLGLITILIISGRPAYDVTALTSISTITPTWILHREHQLSSAKSSNAYF